MEQNTKELAKLRKKHSVQNPTITGLVSRTVNFARAYSVQLDETEAGLEEELRRESCVPPASAKFARFRHNGELLLHSKHVLLTIVILNLIDCALVLGELVLDIHYIKVLIEKTDLSSQNFINHMQLRYPDHIYSNDIENMDRLYEQIYRAECAWNDSTTPLDMHLGHSLNNHTRSLKERSVIVHDVERSLRKRAVSSHSPHYTLLNGTGNNSHHDSHVHKHEHSIWEEIAHGLHKASITILGILFVENILKIALMRCRFFTKKLEVFDAVVVGLSFVIDLVFLKGLSGYKVQDSLLILSFLLPWRVIRVVNSLIVAVLDHEHFRLKLLYKEKKVIAAELKVLREKEKKFDFHLHKIEQFCESEGIPKWKIRQHTAMGRKQSTITSMASLALGGLLTGIVTSKEDNIMFNKSMSLQCTSLPSQDSTATASTTLDIIDESDNDATDPGARQSSVTESEMDYRSSIDETDDINAERNNNTGSTRNRLEHNDRHGNRRILKSVSFEEVKYKPMLVRQNSVQESPKHETPGASPSPEPDSALFTFVDDTGIHNSLL